MQKGIDSYNMPWKALMTALHGFSPAMPKSSLIQEASVTLKEIKSISDGLLTATLKIESDRDKIAESAREVTMYILAGELAESHCPSQKNKLFSHRLRGLRNLSDLCESLQITLKTCIEKSMIFQDNLSRLLPNDTEELDETWLRRIQNSLNDHYQELFDLISLYKGIIDLLDRHGIKS